jgi:hypothetical protein
MIAAAPIKPMLRAILAYDEKVQGSSAHDVFHEIGLHSAFQQLLEEIGKAHQGS